MKKLNATLSTLTLALLSLIFSQTALAQQPPDDVQGNWTIYSTSIKDGSTVIKHVQIAQYGNRITGYFEGPDQSGPIQGEVKGHFIRFSTVTRTILNFHGHVFGDSMSGDYGIHGKQAPWQAERTTGMGAAPQAVTTYGQSMLIPPRLNRRPWPRRRSPIIRSSQLVCAANGRERCTGFRHRSRRINSTALWLRSHSIQTLWWHKCSRRLQSRTKSRQRINGLVRIQTSPANGSRKRWISRIGIPVSRR